MREVSAANPALIVVKMVISQKIVENQEKMIVDLIQEEMIVDKVADLMLSAIIAMKLVILPEIVQNQIKEEIIMLEVVEILVEVAEIPLEVVEMKLNAIIVMDMVILLEIVVSQKEIEMIIEEILEGDPGQVADQEAVLIVETEIGEGVAIEEGILRGEEVQAPEVAVEVKAQEAEVDPKKKIDLGVIAQEVKKKKGVKRRKTQNNQKVDPRKLNK